MSNSQFPIHTKDNPPRRTTRGGSHQPLWTTDSPSTLISRCLSSGLLRFLCKQHDTQTYTHSAWHTCPRFPSVLAFHHYRALFFERFVLLGVFKQVFVTLLGYVSFAPVSFFATAPPYQKSYPIAASHFADFWVSCVFLECWHFLTPHASPQKHLTAKHTRLKNLGLQLPCLNEKRQSDWTRARIFIFTSLNAALLLIACTINQLCHNDQHEGRPLTTLAESHARSSCSWICHLFPREVLSNCFVKFSFAC